MPEILGQNINKNKNFVSSCIWESKPCDYRNFTPVITDFGLCYTFNGDINNPLKTNKTGKKKKINQKEIEYFFLLHTIFDTCSGL